MKKMDVKHIFTDMDGTLLTSEGRVSARNARRIKSSGIPMTLVSARAPMDMIRSWSASIWRNCGAGLLTTSSLPLAVWI